MKNNSAANLIQTYLSFEKKLTDITENREQKIEKLALKWQQLFGNLTKDLERVISYIMAELGDNIEQHSQATGVDIFFHKDSDAISFLVTDNGITIRKSLKSSIHEAIKGKSRKKDTGRGTGLPSIKSLVSGLKGELVILSGKDNYALNTDHKLIKDLSFKGTIVGISISLKAKCGSEKFFKLIEPRNDL